MARTFFQILWLMTFFMSPNISSATERSVTGEQPRQDFRAWVQTNPKGIPASVGFTALAERMLNLPMNEMFILSLPLPHNKNLPFTHIYFEWNPHGHEPPEIYGVPHFDVHFYILSQAEREAITCAGDDQARCQKQPLAAAVPSNYVPTPAGVPKMGWHWADILSPEFHGESFTKTMIFGYYDGELAFLEPMVTRDYLKTHPNFKASIRQPQIYPKSSYYPKSYQIQFLPVSDEIEIVLTDFVFRK